MAGYLYTAAATNLSRPRRTFRHTGTWPSDPRPARLERAGPRGRGQGEPGMMSDDRLRGRRGRRARPMGYAGAAAASIRLGGRPDVNPRRGGDLSHPRLHPGPRSARPDPAVRLAASLGDAGRTVLAPLGPAHR